MRPVLLLVALSSLTACSSSSEPESEAAPFGVAEAQTAIAGTYTGTWSSEGKTGSIELRLDLTASAQPKCGNRTLSLKCIDVTTVRLVGTLTTSPELGGGALTAAPVSGSLQVFGEAPTTGELSVSTNEGRALTASFAKEELTNGKLALDGGGTLTFTAKRIAR